MNELKHKQLPFMAFKSATEFDMISEGEPFHYHGVDCRGGRYICRSGFCSCHTGSLEPCIWRLGHVEKTF